MVFHYLDQHYIIVKRPRVVHVVLEDCGHTKGLLHALWLDDAVLTQDHFHQVAPKAAQEQVKRERKATDQTTRLFFQCHTAKPDHSDILRLLGLEGKAQHVP